MYPNLCSEQKRLAKQAEKEAKKAAKGPAPVQGKPKPKKVEEELDPSKYFENRSGPIMAFFFLCAFAALLCLQGFSP